MTMQEDSVSPDKFLAVQTYLPASLVPALRILTLALPVSLTKIFRTGL